MRIQKTKKDQKKLLIAVIILAVLLIGAGTVYALKLSNDAKTESQKTDSIDYSPPTSEQVKSGTSIKQDSIDNTNTSDSPSAPTPQPGSSMSTVEVSMTSVNQNGNQLQVRFQVDADTSSGTCKITLSKDGKVLTYSAGVQLNSKVASCQGFNIPIDASNLSKGSWQLAMNYTSTTLTGSLNTTIEVK